MFGIAKEMVIGLAEQEILSAAVQHESNFRTMADSWMAIDGEVNEVCEKMSIISNGVVGLKQCAQDYNVSSYVKRVEDMENDAIELVQESIQVLAMIRKTIKSVE